jgi:hypothetical protein
MTALSHQSRRIRHALLLAGCELLGLTWLFLTLARSVFFCLPGLFLDLSGRKFFRSAAL